MSLTAADFWVAKETAESPYADAFLTLAHSLRIIHRCGDDAASTPGAVH